MKVIKRDNAVINYQIVGNGNTTLVFVHGSYITQEYWKDQIAYFNPSYTVVTLDLPGQGKSGTERQEWSVKGYAEDIVTLVKELDLKNVILIGHSLAGDINLVAATSHPNLFLGFIGIENFKNAATPLSEEAQKQTDKIQENLKSNFADTNEQYARMALLTKETPPEISDKIVEAYRNAYQPMGIPITTEIFKMYQTEEKLLPQLKCKLHLINVDYMPTNEVALKKYAGCDYDLQHMVGTCHYPMLENPDELNKLLQQAIDKILKHMH